MIKTLRVLSLGAGVQSSTVALMIRHGEIEPVDFALFADTASEPQGVYKYLSWLEQHLPFPVFRISKSEGGLRKNIIESINGGRFASVPFYTESNGERGGMLRRQCTKEFKIDPINQAIRKQLGIAKGQRAPREILATSLIGISTDEAHRMKPSRVYYIKHEWPLIEASMSRGQCVEWLTKHKYPIPPKSACTFCPYHSDAMWREMKNNDQESFADAVDIDNRIRGGVRGTKQKLYLHRSMKPLSEIDFRNASDVGQTDMFGDECEGMCGL